MIIVIPARAASYRLPNKPLRIIGGKPIIQHTYERAAQAASANRIVIATDAPEVEEVCRQFGAETAMTYANLANGTERVADLVKRLDLPLSEVIINVQGDKFEVDPLAIDEIYQYAKECLVHNRHRTLFCMHEEFQSSSEIDDPGIVKVITSKDDRALYFTRVGLPAAKRHCGIYAYYPTFLDAYTMLTNRELEKQEGLEQMRVLENGMTAYCPRLTSCKTSGRAINTPQDFDNAVTRYTKEEET